MSRIRFILLLSICMISCSRTSDIPDFTTPEFLSVKAETEGTSVVLTAVMKDAVRAEYECGFHIGESEASMVFHNCDAIGNSFALEMEDMKPETRFVFKAAISNGYNEISSELMSFVTGSRTQPVTPPDNPEDPEGPDEPENPGPDEPENPEPDEPEPDEPESDFPPETEIPQDTDEPIRFADSKMKEMCVNAFDLNADGELSYAEAQAVTDISQMKRTTRGISSFDEFRFFTGVCDIPEGYFRGFGFSSITLPESINVINGGAFKECPNLKRVNLPLNLRICYQGFHNCRSLSEIHIEDISTLFNVDWGWMDPDRILDGRNLYIKGKKVTSLVIPGEFETIANFCFLGCQSFREVIIEEGFKTIQWGFSDCTNLEKVTLPSTIVEIGNLCFSNTSVEDVYIKADFPPVIYENTFETNHDSPITFHVPEAQVEEYKSDPMWSRHATHIVGHKF